MLSLLHGRHSANHFISLINPNNPGKELLPLPTLQMRKLHFRKILHFVQCHSVVNSRAQCPTQVSVAKMLTVQYKTDDSHLMKNSPFKRTLLPAYI